MYDPATGRFSPGPDMASQRYKLPDGAVQLPSGDVLVAAGAAQVERFDASTGRFVALSGELEGPHEFATSTLLESGDVLVLGGYGERIERLPVRGWCAQRHARGIGQVKARPLPTGVGVLPIMGRVLGGRKNVFSALVQAVKTHSLGQGSHALYEVGGEYRRNL